MPFFVVKYDVLSLQADKPYSDMSTVAPAFIEGFDTKEEADANAETLTKADTSEEVDIVLKNGKQYKGHRYIYRVCTQEF